MIVTRLIGGLGNQMFQYAAGRALAKRRDVPLKIDTSGFAIYKVHPYDLYHFALEATEADSTECPRGEIVSPLGRLRRRLGLSAPTGLRVYREQDFTFDPHVLALAEGTYLDGYWQSERYFSDCQPVIRQNFSFRTPPSRENAEWLARIAETLAVSVHVRRGDYASNPRTLEVHGLCSLDYYVHAAHFIAEHLEGTPEFYVFSDEPGWVRVNLRLDFPTHYVAHNDVAHAYEDMRLMSNCRHHIIANSTFSWWGAWLNPTPVKIVIAPKRWFRDESIDDRDLIPASWVRL